MKTSMLYIVMLFISPSVLAHSEHNIVSNVHSHLLTAETQHTFLSHTNLFILSILLMMIIGYSVYAYVKK